MALADAERPATAAASSTRIRRVRRVACGRCGEGVLEALVGGGLSVLLDRVEELPPMRCPQCLSARLRDKSLPCWRCGSRPDEAGWIGRDLALVLGVLVDESGGCRLYFGEQTERRPAEALHVPHRCPGA